MWEDTFDCKPAHKANNNINNIGDKPSVIGAIKLDKYVVRPIDSLVIAAPRASVAETITILGQETPFTIDSFKLINGFFSNFNIESNIIPRSGGIAVPKSLIHVNKFAIHSIELDFNKLGSTHKAITKINTAKIVFSPLLAFGTSFFISSNSLDFKFNPFVEGLIINLNTNIIIAKIIIPVGIANNIYCP